MLLNLRGLQALDQPGFFRLKVRNELLRLCFTRFFAVDSALKLLPQLQLAVESPLCFLGLISTDAKDR